MKTLFAVTYTEPEKAKLALSQLVELQEGATIALVDAVIVTRSEDGAVRLDQKINTTAVGAVSGAMWGSLIGLLFLSPILGAAVGAGAGALSGYATDYGISDSFMTKMAERMKGSSATLFVLASDMVPDKVADVLNRHGGQIAYTSMPEDIEERFKARFAPTEVDAALAAEPAMVPPPDDQTPRQAGG